jgi:hypothetical protein
MPRTSEHDRTRPAVHPFHLRASCANCPFRTDLAGGHYLTHDRAREIADGLREGATFHCHKTTVYGDDGEGDPEGTLVADHRSQACAGALGTMLRERGGQGYWPQDVRMAIGFGWYDPERMDKRDPLYDSLSDWVDAHRDEPVPTVTTDEGETIPYEHCGVVGPYCVDPAGYAMGGGAVRNDSDPTCNPLEACYACGNAACESCWAEGRAPGDDHPDGPLCVTCVEDEDDDEDSDNGPA